MTFRLATRGSALALWQADDVARRLVAAHPGLEVSLVVVDTRGDLRQDRQIWELGSQGVFVKEVQAAVLSGRADAAVHSAKDLPSSTAGLGSAAGSAAWGAAAGSATWGALGSASSSATGAAAGSASSSATGAAAVGSAASVVGSAAGSASGSAVLTLAAFPCRADPRDALVGSRLADLEAGAVVATGSVRRRAQLAWLRPDLVFVGLRGNIVTRLERVPVGGAVVVASAALDRLGLGERAAEILEPAVMLPQVGQGAIAVECLADDSSAIGLLGAIDDSMTAVAVRAERAFLARLGGACDLPVGAYATLEGQTVAIEGLVASVDGKTVLRERTLGPVLEAEALGAALAETLLDGRGGRALLAGDSRLR